VEDGAYRINHRPKEKTPVAEWLKKQGRFAHLFRSKEGEELVHTLQEEVDREWEHLLSVAE
jgi:pyruvate ferredoxin oxidoreductase beta subunit